MSPDTLRDLIARVEAATGWDAMLDEDICAAVVGLSADLPAPAYTASLDAAVSLVPEGWKASVCTEGSAAVWQRWKDDALVIVAATPALALCAAALRARLAMMEDQR